MNQTSKISSGSFLSAFLLSLISGIALAFSFPSFDLWPLAWMGLVPLLYAIEGKRPFQAAFLAYCTGITFFVLTIYWIIHVTLLGLIFLVFYLAIYFGLFGLFAAGFAHREKSWYSLFFLPCVWVVLEFIRARLLTGFGWVSLGYSQYKILPVIQIADIGSVYTVSFLLVVGNVLIKEIITGLKEKTFSVKKIIAPIACISIAVLYGSFKLERVYPKPTNESWRLSADSVRVSVVQGNIHMMFSSATTPESAFEIYRQLSGQAAQDIPALIIWPEAALARPIDEFLSRVTQLAKGLKVYLLLGNVIPDDGKFFNSALLISSDGAVVERYDKLHLVPYGEFIPYRTTFPFLSSVVPIGDFTAGKDYTVFSVRHDDRKVQFSVLICFEDVFPELARMFTKRGAQFLVNITDDVWFKRSSEPYQHLSASVFRAVENRRAVVRAANTGVSCFIDPYGRISKRVGKTEGRDIWVKGFATETIPLSVQRTLYTAFGDVFVVLCAAAVLIGLVKRC